MDSEIIAYFSKIDQWKKELLELRTIILSCPLEEKYKWRIPCYTFENKNVIGISILKDGACLSFFKGVLLANKEGILIKPGENSQSGRLIKFKSVEQILSKKAIIRSYILEAIEIERTGMKIELKKTSDYEIPSELENVFGENEKFHIAFKALTPGRQRGYLLHFAGAKQSQTRQSRIIKAMPRIMDGKGIHDCICGLSNKMPRCDGSHKNI